MAAKTVALSYLQRLQLYGMLEQWRGWKHSELRRVWALMDRVDLDAEERAAIGFEIRIVNGEERRFWDGSPKNPPVVREFSVHEQDCARIKRCIEGFPFAGQDRKWLVGLMECFTPEAMEDEE